MKTKDRKELAAKTEKELVKMQADLQMQLAQVRMEKKAGKLANTSLVSHLSDDLARVKTVLSAKMGVQKETE